MPQMQALAERLDAAIGGGTIAGLDAIQFASLKTFDPAPEALAGRAVERVGRRGKYIVADVEGGARYLLHLSQGGRVDIEDPPKATRPKQGVMRIRMVDRPSVLVKEFGTERKAGWWLLEAGDDGPLVGLGPEILGEEATELLRTSDDRRRVHTILRDQRTVAGLGRGYTDDALHRGRISPFASLASLDPAARQRLVDAIAEVLAGGLVHERARTGGLPNKLGDHWIVHHRHGEPCPACGEVLHRVSYESYEVTYCPACQTGGKILADRRLSRLLK
ncbi:MAG: DNA-formamidopyrimidine glycosylase family protein [Acidimicrobiia bacterium]